MHPLHLQGKSFVFYTCLDKRKMAHPVPTKDFLEPAKTATHLLYPTLSANRRPICKMDCADWYHSAKPGWWIHSLVYIVTNEWRSSHYLAQNGWKQELWTTMAKWSVGLLYPSCVESHFKTCLIWIITSKFEVITMDSQEPTCCDNNHLLAS